MRLMEEVYEYGNDGTWHDSTALDVETDSDGNVVGVWFRCQLIPFQQVLVGDERAAEMVKAFKDLSLELQAVKLKVVDKSIPSE